MLQIYLPIIKASISLSKIIFVGLLSGVFSGAFGVGSGFFVIPTLIFMGIPAKYAVSSSNGQSITPSFSSMMTYHKKNSVDFQLGSLMLIGTITGMLTGTKVFTFLTKIGWTDIVISICYILVLGSIGTSMCIESIKSIANKKNTKNTAKKNKIFEFIEKLPFKVYLIKGKIEISAMALVIIGFISGFLLSLAGISLAFLMLPTLTYVLRIPTTLVIGTTYYNTMIVCSLLTITQAIYLNNVDILLLLPLMLSSLFGSKIGYKINAKIPPEVLRSLLSLIMLGFVLKLILKLTVKPTNLYSMIEL
ncbi:putative membrane transporter protein [Candidatus Xenohaliotis californiensis]|uniref:Probable membrane transporter protein n=1 Tax=Candidatus Xenohaliotis californiensis TaxID=84677 RepID=A0ABM9N854_9RICK|nr:putative membrane transporter protein [Candidatus Xenohaliotis californiensis]